MESFSNCFQPTRDEVMDGIPQKGSWRKEVFGNDHPVVLELGCGRGEYTVGLARLHPEMNFIGVDIKGARIWRGAKTGMEEGLNNVAFLRTQIELITHCFEAGEVDEIWLTFPDPQLKYRRTKHRLTSPEFLDRYRRIMKKGGRVHLKTDSEFLHAYTLGLLQGLGMEPENANHDIYRIGTLPPELEIKTTYEKMFLKEGKPITYLSFTLD
jgi:tRNA (guanine-N7-)-methyltransferase